MSFVAFMYGTRFAIDHCFTNGNKPDQARDTASLDLSFDDLAELKEALELMDALARDDEKNKPVTDVGLSYFSRVDS